MKKIIVLLIIYAAAFFTVIPAFSDADTAAAPVSQLKFHEIWGYLKEGDEGKLRNSGPFSDICYFSAWIDYKGQLTKIKKPDIITNTDGFKPRIHLEITELKDTALLHFCLDPDYGIRDRLIESIVNEASDFDGVQIDFEAVAQDDSEYFLEFLKLLKDQLGDGKILSVALPAVTHKLNNDPYDYKTISSVADRIMIMAYDQYWSTSEPGPVASLPWCRKVLSYALSAVPGGKLIMGIPLYGRSWQDKSYNLSLRANYIGELFSNTNIIITRNYSQDEGPSINYYEKVKVTVYYEDMDSTMEKLMLYNKYIDSVAFWRIGFEDKNIWKLLQLEN